MAHPGADATAPLRPPEAEPFLLAPGDGLRFVPVDEGAFDAIAAEASRAARAGGGGMITVLKPGLLTTVQDAGEAGHRASGMPVAGAMDRLAFALANRIAGNHPGRRCSS